MKRGLGSPVARLPGSRSRLPAATVAAAALLFLVLAYAGHRGKRQPERQAQLAEIQLCRDELQKALDAQRTEASGPKPKRSAPAASSSSRAIREWTAKLKRRIADFRSTLAPASEDEDPGLRTAEATLAIAERRFTDALSAIEPPAEQRGSGASGTRERQAAILRVRADAAHDQRQWPAALDNYRQVLLRQPEDLTVLERVAGCLYALEQRDSALPAYADLAKRLHDRGSRLLAQMDPGSAAQDFNRAANLRLWLLEQGRRDLTADLARSFSACAQALIEIRSLDPARVYLGHAIDIQTQLLRAKAQDDLAGDLAANHARYADILLERGEPQDALAHFGDAIDIVSRLVEQGQSGLRKSLATTLAHRGLAHQARGQLDAAAQDFEKAAGGLAALGEFEDAVVWQTRARDLAGAEKREEAQSRLDHYRSGKPYPGSSPPGP